MSGSDKDFDARLANLFDAAAPPADDRFTRAVMEAVPAPALARPVLLVLAGLAGALAAGWQLPSLMPALTRVMDMLGGAAVETLGQQAIIMGLVTAVLAGVMLVLFRRGGLDL